MIYKLLKNKKTTVRVLLSVAIAGSVSLDASAYQPAENAGLIQATDTSLAARNNQLAPPDTIMLKQEAVSLPSLIKTYIPGLTVAGYYRGYFYGRTMTAPYGTVGINRQLSVGDQVYFGDPMLYLYVGGNVTPSLSFATELNLVNPMTGPAYNTNEFKVYNAMLMRGSYNGKKFGTYNVVVGGIEWKKLSALTFGGNVKYNRYSVFERLPWDPIGSVKTKYAAYYETGTFSQDARFGTNAFKGVMISGFNMPGKLSGEFMYGRSGANAGNLRADIVKPKYDIAGKLARKFDNESELSLNTYNSIIQTDSIKVDASSYAQINIYSLNYNVRIKDFDISAEAGLGKYESPAYLKKWDNAVIVNLGFPKNYTFIPITMRYYRIGKGFVNKNASFTNTSVEEVSKGFSNGVVAVVTQPFGAGMMSVGDLANNRQSVNINGEIKLGKLKVIIGNEISSELEALPGSTAINVSSTVNALSWSRLANASFEGGTYGFGPAGRMNTYYRGVFESVNINGPAFKKYYNSLEVQLKYKNKFLGRDFYIYQLNTFNSAQDKMAPVTIFNDAALVRTATSQIDLYYHVSRDLMIDFYYGYERIQSNDKTENNTGHNRNETGTALGLGFDLSISQNTALYYRHRWFAFEDANFKAERFKGTEGTIELKLYF